jgi:hypothetical protein
MRKKAYRICRDKKRKWMRSKFNEIAELSKQKKLGSYTWQLNKQRISTTDNCTPRKRMEL